MVTGVGPRVTDHALVRFLERSGMNVEAVRASVTEALARSHELAEAIGGGDHLISVDGLTFVVRDATVITVTATPAPRGRASLLARNPT